MVDEISLSVLGVLLLHGATLSRLQSRAGRGLSCCSTLSACPVCGSSVPSHADTQIRAALGGLLHVRTASSPRLGIRTLRQLASAPDGRTSD